MSKKKVEREAAKTAAAERLLRVPASTSAEPDFEALADRLAKKFAASAAPDPKALTDEAVTRESIYGDHP